MPELMTVDKAPSYRQAFIKRRCLIPADGFYEWRKTPKPKLPFAIAMKDDRPFTFAADQMRMWEISPRVNSPKKDDPSLWEPLRSESAKKTEAETLELVP